MTRINIGVPPKKLSRQHLLAEHREIVRIPNAVKSGRAVLKDIPEKFTLGKGHVKFFYDKLLFLKKRYDDLYNECKMRGYNVTDFRSAFENIPEHLFNDFSPSESEIFLILQRIEERSNKQTEKQ